MSGRRSKKNQRLGSSRRGPKGLNRNIEKDDDEDDGFQQIAESGDGQNEFHTITDHSAQFDLPPSSSIDQQTSVLECPPHARSLKDSLMETELPERKRKMGSTRKSAGGFKVERKLEVRTTEDLDEYVTQSNTSASEEQHPSLTEDEQSRSSSFSSNLSLQTESSGLGGEPRATLMVVVSENEEKDAIHHQEITSHSYEVVSDTPIDKAMGGSVYSGAATVAESDLLREDSVMFNELKTLSRQETPLASTSGQKRKMGSTRRPLGGKKSENVGLQEHSRTMTGNERKAEVIDEANFSNSEEMVQTWDDVARDDPSSHSESSLVSNQSLLAERAELNKPDVSAGTETMNHSVAFPLVDPEKPLPETSSHHGTLLLNKGLDFKFGSNTEDFDVPNKVLEEAGSNLSDDNQHVPDTRNDTNTSHNCRDVNTVEGKEEVLKQKEEPSRNNKTSSLSSRQDAQLEELELNCEKSPSLSQNNNFDDSTAQLIEGGNSGFDVPASTISHAKPTTTNSPHEISDAVEESQEMYVEMTYENNVCDVASMTCDTLTDLECDEDERGSETDNGFEITVQGDARDHHVAQLIMEVRNNKEDGGKSNETILISNQEPCEVSTEKEELHREQEYSSTISRTQSGPPQDNAGKMLEIDSSVILQVAVGSEETDTVNKESDISPVIPEDSQDSYKLTTFHSETQENEGDTDIVPVGGDTDLEIQTQKETFSLVDEPSPDKSTSQSSKDGAKEQEMEICEKNDVGPVEGSESAFIQSSFSLDSVSDESTAVTISHITESQTLTKMNEESQENTGDVERVPAEGDTESHSEIQTEIKPTDLTTSEAETTEESIRHATVLVEEVEFIVDTVTVESNMTESDLLQNDTVTVANLETLKVSENIENVSSVTDTGLLVQDDATEGSGETNTIPDESDTNIIPEDTHREEAHSKSSPIAHKRKMGSTRRPLKGNKGQRKGMKYHDENETLDSEATMNVEKEAFSLEDEPSPDKSTSQSSKDGAKEQEMEICEKNDVGPVEGSESALIQSSFSLDSVSEESTAVTISHITESQTLTKMNEESQENTGDVERVPAEGDTESHSEIQTEIKTTDLTSEAERTEESIRHATVLVEEVDFIVDTVTVENNMTESDLLQNDTVTVANLETLKVSENIENVSSVTDTGPLVQDDATEGSGETNTIPDKSDIDIIPEDTHREEAHSKPSPIAHKRKMGSTRRPLRGDTGQRKRREYHDENETLDSEATMNVEKETFSLEDEPSPDKSTSQRSKDGAKEQQMEICEKNDVGPVEGSESAFIQSSFSLDSVSEESTAVTISHITESQTLTKMNQDSRENTGDAERVKFENVENKVSGETKTITELIDINLIPEDSHREEVHAKFSPVVHKRKMGSTRRPLRGNKGQKKVELSGEEDTETLSEIQDQDNVVNHNVTQDIMNVRDDENEERMTTKLEDMSLQLCDDLKQEQRSDVSQTQTGPALDDTGSNFLDVPERTADFVRDSLTSHSDLVVSDALLMEETQIHVSYEDVVKGDTCVPPTEVVEMHSVSNRSLQKRKLGSTRKRGKGMVHEEEVEEEKEGDAENTTTDDGTTKSEEKLTLEESITGSLVHQQALGSSAGKESHDIQIVASKSDMQTENSEQNDQNQAAEIVSDLPLGDVETYSVPEQSEITSIIFEESHRKDVQSNSIPAVQKRKMGSTRKTLRGSKGQRREVESKQMDAESKGMAKVQDTDPHLAISEGENKCKLDEQNFPVEFSEDGVKEVSLNIHDSSEVSKDKGMENTVNDSNSLNEAINLYGGTTDKFVLTVSCEDIHQTMSADYLDQHVHGGSEPEQTETTCQVFPTQVLKNIQDDVVHENSSQKIPSTHEKKRKIGSTRRNPRVMHGKNMGDQDDILDMAMDRETKKAEDNLDDMPLASNISQPKEMSSEAVSTINLESEMLVSTTDLKGGENDYQNNSDPNRTTGPGNQLVSVDVTKHLQPETVPVEKKRKMGSTRKNVREGRIRGKRDVYEDTETAETHLQMSQDSEISLVGQAVGDQTIHDHSNLSEDSLLSEIERALNKTSQSSSNYELIVNEPNSDDLVKTSHLNKPENSEIKSLQLKPSQSSKTHSEPNSPERRRRKMGSTRKNPRQQIKTEREDEDKEDGEIEENLEANKQEMENLERVETSVVHNIPENKLNKEYLDVPSAHTSSSQLEESSNPIVQERTSPSTKRKFGSRRTNKGKQGLGRLDASDKSELGDEVEDNLRSDDLTVCDPHPSLQPESQPIFQPISEHSNMEARNEEAAPKGTGAGLVSLDQIIKHDRSTGTKQTIHLKNRNSELQFNVVMVGNSCVGKTSFIRRFHEGQYTEDYRSTIGVDTFIQTVELPDRTVKLQIWDTAGQERFHSITSQVFRKADGILLMYEITCSKSFISVRDWISEAREKAPDDAIMILLGNKNDSVERKVQIQEGADLAKEYNIHFMECSAATGANVSESMGALAELLVQRKKRKEEHTTLRREPPPKKSGCC
ncbi:hypothetical protein PO909_005456 [Leuciscus waleckii]